MSTNIRTFRYLIIFATVLHLEKSMKAVRNMDIWGTTTSLLCAVHCAALPILLSIGLISDHSWLMNPIFEIVVLSLTGLFIYFSIIRSYLKDRSDKRPIVLALTGVLLIICHHIFPFQHGLVIAFGGGLIAIAHLTKLKLTEHSH